MTISHSFCTKVAIVLMLSTVLLSGCIHKVVTVPAKLAYGTTKAVVKGTVAVTKAVIPGDSDNDSNNSDNKKSKKDKD